MAGAGYKLFNTGDVLTAAQVNTYLQEQVVMRFATTTARDTALSGVLAEGMICYIDADNNLYKYTGSAWVNVDSGSASPLTTKGDLYTYSTVDTRLAVGTNGHVLTADSAEATGLKWAAPASASFVGCSLEMSAQTLSNNTDTNLLWDSELYDTDNMHSTSTNTSRITIPTGKGGYYQFSWSLMFAANTAGNRRARLFKNGSSYDLGTVLTVGAPNGGLCGFSNSAVVSAAAGDYFEIQAFQDSGGSLNTGGTGNSFQAWKVG